MKKRICLAISIMIFLLGVWGILTRKDPIEKNIGYAYISYGENVKELKGYKVSVCRKGKTSDYEYPDIKSEKDKLYTVKASEENSGDMNLAYSKKYYGDVLYSVYDSEFNRVSESEAVLNIPNADGTVYYVSASVLWGNETENVNMIYYFSIQT